MQILSQHKLPLLHSSGPIEASEQISRFLAPTRVTASRDFSRTAYVSGIRIGSVSIGVIALGAAVSVEAISTGHDAAMVLCLQGSGEMIANGRVTPLRAQHGLVIRPSGSLRARFSADCLRMVIRFESHHLDALAARSASFELADPALRPWLEYIQFILSSRSMIAAIAQDPVVRERVEDLLVALLQHVCRPMLSADVNLDLAVGRWVRRAEAYMRAHAADIGDLAEIAKVAGASERTLQTSFKSRYKVSPMLFLRNLRLDNARERILAGSTVSDAALASGFPHLGRFAKYYAERFGDLPSSNARRAWLS
jgi:AraC-like DNA-binding protein